MKKILLTLVFAILPMSGRCSEMPLELENKLDALGEKSLLSNWEQLSDSQQANLSAQVQALDVSYLIEQRTVIDHPQGIESYEPFQDYVKAGSADNLTIGTQLISEGRVGCLVLAGGQGTRLGFKGPKGMYPISAIHQKTLFQMLAEKVVAASKTYKRALPFAVMTSPLNDAETKAYFIQNEYFGLNPSQVFFFSQEMLPFLDADGMMFLESQDSIALGPNGNGYTLHLFYSTGVYEEWKKQGVSFVNVVLVDNPLADPFDAELVGFQAKRNDEVTFKSIKRDDPKESIGVIVRKGNRLSVVEYSEISDEERNAKVADGSLKHPCGSLSLFSFSMDFIYKVAQNKQMPLHKAYKKTPKLGDTTGKFYAWKFEAFIFDVLKWADKVSVLVFDREDCFAPLKNSAGANSPETVRAAILSRERKIVERITGIAPPDQVFELPADFYYPTPELLKEQKGKGIQDFVGSL